MQFTTSIIFIHAFDSMNSIVFYEQLILSAAIDNKIFQAKKGFIVCNFFVIY